MPSSVATISITMTWFFSKFSIPLSTNVLPIISKGVTEAVVYVSDCPLSGSEADNDPTTEPMGASSEIGSAANWHN